MTHAWVDKDVVGRTSWDEGLTAWDIGLTTWDGGAETWTDKVVG